MTDYFSFLPVYHDSSFLEDLVSLIKHKDVCKYMAEGEAYSIYNLSEELNDSNIILTVLRNDIVGSIVGFGRIKKDSRHKIKHVAEISLGLHPEFQGYGLGRDMLQFLLKTCKDIRCQRVTLYCVCENIRALNLYLSEGFRIVGTLQKAILIDGEYKDEYFMEKEL